ncbi:MAG TPA: alpha/beta hydrolase [Thermoleophilaceae bacterium]
MELAFTDAGNGTPVVLLHGQPGNAGDWAPVIARLEKRVRAIAPDRPGYGRTAGRAVGFRENAKAVAELLDRLGIDSAVLAGHSWATAVALAAAVDFPERVRALVLAAPVAPGVPPSLADRALAHPVFGPAVARVGFRASGWGLAAAPVRKLARGAVPQLELSQIATSAEQWRRDGVWRSFYLEQRALIEELGSLEPSLDTIQQRALILHGPRDWITPPSHAARLAEVLPEAELLTVERAGHMLPQQRPDAVAEAILRAAEARR